MYYKGGNSHGKDYGYGGKTGQQPGNYQNAASYFRKQDQDQGNVTAYSQRIGKCSFKVFVME